MSGYRLLPSPAEEAVLRNDADEMADDLVRDMTEILTSICAHLYRRRSARKRAAAAVRAAGDAT
jgi:putative resolvase